MHHTPDFPTFRHLSLFRFVRNSSTDLNPITNENYIFNTFGTALEAIFCGLWSQGLFLINYY